jgi:hypothetical protein
MKLTKLSAAWLPEWTCRLMPAPSRLDAGTASQLIPGVRQTKKETGVACMIAGVLLAVMSEASGVDANPLAPVDREFRIFAPYPELHGYHRAVRDALLGPWNRRTSEALIIPSFEREWSVHLQTTASGRQIVCTIMQEQLWGRMQAEAERPNGSIRPSDELRALRKLPKGIWRFSAPISATSAAAVDELWAAMLARVEEAPEPIRCLDGTSYYLFQARSSGGTSGGWGRCSQKGTPAAAVLDLLLQLRKAAGSSGTALMRQDMALAAEARRILNQLK